MFCSLEQIYKLILNKFTSCKVIFFSKFKSFRGFSEHVHILNDDFFSTYLVEE